MARTARRGVRGAAPLILLSVLLAGCTSTTVTGKASEPGGRSASQDGGGDRSGGGTVGGEGSGCALPVSFDVARGWEPGATGASQDPKVSFSLVCEVKGTTAPGLLRVWAGGRSGDDPERALRAFVDDFVIRLARAEYAGVEAGEFTGTEVVYTEKDRAGTALPQKSRAFAVRSGEGVVIVHLWGTAGAEAGMRTAYELAKRTVRPST
ncbi:lipoprotein [Streptomyces sp. NPDC127068]|uniref:lipoprotein n=1 Tax=Streptomyces sp. NPDC127068 TaxID=3347127 RepID=UPI00364774B3